MRAHRRTHRRLTVEPLEQRDLLAVTAALEGDDFVVTGDGDSDDIAITQAANGDLTVTG